MTRSLSKAYIDTTVLTDALLKQNAQGDAARSKLNTYNERLLPIYAIKEFKAGPLRHYAWFYNKITTAGSWADAVAAIQRIGATPKRYMLSTIIQALSDFESSMAHRLVPTLAAKYPRAKIDTMKRLEAQVWLKTAILRAWRNRRKIATSTTNDLTCYKETAPAFASNGTVNMNPTRCGVDDCCLRQRYSGLKSEIKKLMIACESMAPRPENQKRRAALRHLVRTPNRFLTEDQCRALGDATFAIDCPMDASILTTNLRDHLPLAGALGKRVEAP